MFAVIYSFKVKPGLIEEFKQTWKELTVLIYHYEQSFGSRLHSSEENVFIAYALWPDKNTWKNSGTKLPSQATILRNRLRDVCEEFNTLHELIVEEDFLKTKQYQ